MCAGLIGIELETQEDYDAELSNVVENVIDTLYVDETVDEAK